jgi:hypothetical protein
MPANCYPALTGCDEHRPIEQQGSHSGAASQSQSDDSGSVRAPGEVLLPLLSTGIEQWHFLLAHWILSDDLLALVPITQRAGQPEILSLRLAPQGLGNQVVDLHRAADHACGCLAVAAPVMSIL